jgi:hypothetical protein
MNRARMIEWLLMAALLYSVCIVLRTLDLEPQVQVVLWKLANVTIAAFVGYWIDRRAFARVGGTTTPLEQIRRALVMAAAMLSVALGL